MDYKNKIKQIGGRIIKIPDNFFHVMSITKAVIGILYHYQKKNILGINYYIKTLQLEML